MTRADRQYAGATGKVLALDDVAELGNAYVVQPKLDGIYGLVSTDRAGRISAIVTRAGELVGPSLLAEFRGVRWMPDSLVACEIELWTEASNRAAAARGYRMIYPFDALRVGGRDVSHESYRVRRDTLLRAEVQVEMRGPDRPWVEDDQGDAHDPRTGRYTRPTPLGWRRVRVVPQQPIANARRAWSEWVDAQAAGPCEGLVAVALDAPLGATQAKRKIKASDAIDCVVLEVTPRALTVWWTAGQRRIAIGRPRSLDLAPGAVVSVTHEGFYEDGTPRFARLSRVRRDLAA